MNISMQERYSSIPPGNQTTAFEKGSATLPSTHIPQGLLPRCLRTRDLMVLCLIAVLLINNVSLVTGAGGAAFIYWIVGGAAFLVPSALICLQLYRLFPGEGAVYLWANRAFGDFVATFLGFFCNWLPGVVGLLVSISAFVTYTQALNPTWLNTPWQQGIAEIVVLLAAQGLCLLPPRILHRIINTVWLAYGSIFLLLTLAALLWLVTGHQPQGDFSARGWQISVSHWPIVAIMILCFVGIEVPLNLGLEVVHPGVVERALKWSIPLVIGGYLLATFAIAVVLPPSDAANPALIAEVMPLVFGPGVGGILQVMTNLILLCYFVCVTAAFNLMFSRLLLVAGMDRRLPRAMQRLSRQRVPVPAMWAQTLINVGLVVVIYFLAPVFGSSNNQEFSLIVFLIVINGGAIIWNLAMIGLFLSGIVLIARYRFQFSGPWILPPPMLHLLACLGIVSAGIAIAGTLFAGSPLPQVLSTPNWTYWILVVVLGSLAVGATHSFLVPEAQDVVALLAKAEGRTPMLQPSVSPGGAMMAAREAVNPIRSAPPLSSLSQPGPYASNPGTGASHSFPGGISGPLSGKSTFS